MWTQYNLFNIAKPFYLHDILKMFNIYFIFLKEIFLKSIKEYRNM